MTFYKMLLISLFGILSCDASPVKSKSIEVHNPTHESSDWHTDLSSYQLELLQNFVGHSNPLPVHIGPTHHHTSSTPPKHFQSLNQGAQSYNPWSVSSQPSTSTLLNVHSLDHAPSLVSKGEEAAKASRKKEEKVKALDKKIEKRPYRDTYAIRYEGGNWQKQIGKSGMKNIYSTIKKHWRDELSSRTIVESNAKLRQVLDESIARKILSRDKDVIVKVAALSVPLGKGAIDHHLVGDANLPMTETEKYSRYLDDVNEHARRVGKQSLNPLAKMPNQWPPPGLDQYQKREIIGKLAGEWGCNPDEVRGKLKGHYRAELAADLLGKDKKAFKEAAKYLIDQSKRGVVAFESQWKLAITFHLTSATPASPSPPRTPIYNAESPPLLHIPESEIVWLHDFIKDAPLLKSQHIPSYLDERSTTHSTASSGLSQPYQHQGQESDNNINHSTKDTPSSSMSHSSPPAGGEGEKVAMPRWRAEWMNGKEILYPKEYEERKRLDKPPTWQSTKQFTRDDIAKVYQAIATTLPYETDKRSFFRTLDRADKALSVSVAQSIIQGNKVNLAHVHSLVAPSKAPVKKPAQRYLWSHNEDYDIQTRVNVKKILNEHLKLPVDLLYQRLQKKVPPPQDVVILLNGSHEEQKAAAQRYHSRFIPHRPSQRRKKRQRQ